MKLSFIEKLKFLIQPQYQFAARVERHQFVTGSGEVSSDLKLVPILRDDLVYIETMDDYSHYILVNSRYDLNEL